MACWCASGAAAQSREEVAGNVGESVRAGGELLEPSAVTIRKKSEAPAPPSLKGEDGCPGTRVGEHKGVFLELQGKPAAR